MKYQQLREQCLKANLDLGSSGLVDMTFGNASVFDSSEKVFAIKPSGVCYNKLTVADTVVVDLDGNVVCGKLRPSSDTPTHRCLFIAFGQNGINAVAHTHSRKAVAFAQAGEPIPCFGTTHADYFRGSIPVTRAMTEKEVSGDYEWETGKVIIEAFEDIDPVQMSAVLVRNHGPFVWADCGEKAVENAMALELVADMAMQTILVNRNVNEAPTYLQQKHFLRKHGDNAYYGQEK